MDFPISEVIVVFFSGMAAGVINIMAGGGSTITLGVLIFLGMDASIANGTNRIGLMVESTSGVLAFRSKNYSAFGESFKLSLFTLPGAVLGAISAVRISNELFQQILAVVMILILITLFLPKSLKEKADSGSRKLRGWAIYPAMFLIGFYGGFIQVGIGFLLMGALRHLLHLDLIRVNMHKVFIVFIYTIPILFIFGLTGNIDWFYAVFLAGGYAVGAWWSAKVSIAGGEKVVKVVLGVAIIIMSAKLLYPFFS
jgi:uncharacterized protein